MLRAPHDHATNRARRLAAIQSSFALGETHLLDHAVEKFVTDDRLFLKPDSREWRDFANNLARAEIKALQHTLERYQGDYTGSTIRAGERALQSGRCGLLCR